MQASVNQSAAQFTEIKAFVLNRSAWPARTFNGTLRYYFTLDGATTPSQISVTTNYNQCGTASAPTQYRGAVYYVEIPCSGVAPAGQSAYRKEVQFRITSTGTWNPADDWSYAGLGSGKGVTQTDRIVLRQDGKTVWGREPGGVVDDSEPPTVPIGLTASNPGSTSVTLSWTASADNVGVTAYEILNGTTVAGSTAGTSLLVTGLAPDTPYSFSVRARDAAGNVSAAGTPVSTRTLPGATSTLTVQHKGTGAAVSNQVGATLQLTNRGTTPVSLATTTARYWFTGDAPAATYQVWCDWAQIGCANVQARVVKLAAARPGADAYLEVSFASGSLAAGASTGEIQLRVAKSDWSGFDQADDHSYRISAALTDFDRVTAYSGGVLTWGAEP